MCNISAPKGVSARSHPPYSPDSAPCDYFLFFKLKIKPKGNQFNTILNIQIQSNTTLSSISKENYQRFCNRCKSYILSTKMSKHSLTYLSPLTEKQHFILFLIFHFDLHRVQRLIKYSFHLFIYQYSW